MAENGEDGLTTAQTERPDLIILDVLMPGIDGGKVAEKLKEDARTKNIPVIFSTCLKLKRKKGEEKRVDKQDRETYMNKGTGLIAPMFEDRQDGRKD